jgi:hypothetical protein
MGMASPDAHISVQPRGRTGRDLLRLWEWAGRSGRMNEHTANQYRAACARVLDVLPDGMDRDLATLDLPKTAQRFRQASRSSLAEGTVDTYESIFLRAVPSLMDFMADRSNWMPPVAYTKRTRRLRAEPDMNTGLDTQTPLREINMTLPSGGRAEIHFPDGATAADLRFLAAVLPNYVTT